MYIPYLNIPNSPQNVRSKLVLFSFVLKHLGSNRVMCLVVLLQSLIFRIVPAPQVTNTVDTFLM